VSRVFKISKWAHVFESARRSFSDVVARGVELNLSPLSDSDLLIDFKGDYSRANFEELEIDSLVKLAVPPTAVWAADPSAAKGTGGELFRIVATGHAPLPAMPSAAIKVMVRAPDAALNDSLSTATAHHYPPLASHYVVGETYGPLNHAGSAAAKTPIQKLLQLERILCFLLEKEEKPVLDCVLGVVLMGPTIDSKRCARVYAALVHYQSVLVRLWALCNTGRFLAIRLQSSAAELSRQLEAVEEMADDVKATKAMMLEMAAKIDEVLAFKSSRCWV